MESFLDKKLSLSKILGLILIIVGFVIMHIDRFFIDDTLKDVEQPIQPIDQTDVAINIAKDN